MVRTRISDPVAISLPSTGLCACSVVALLALAWLVASPLELGRALGASIGPPACSPVAASTHEGQTAPVTFSCRNSPTRYSVAADPSNGKLSNLDRKAGTVTYTPNPAYTGSDSFTYIATNAAGDSQPARVNITVSAVAHSTPPACSPVAASTHEGQTAPVTFSCRNSPTRYSVAADPSNGKLSNLDRKAGTVTYTPNPAYTGSDSFTYIATNAAGDSQPARVNITVSAVAQGTPPACSPVAASTHEGQTAPVTFSCRNSPTRYSVAADPSNGKLSNLDRKAGTVTYTPNPAYTGSDSFTYIATNAAGDSQPARVNITVSAVAHGTPPACSPVAASTHEGQTAPVTFSCRNSPTRYSVAADPSNGKLSNLDRKAGTVTYTPNPAYTGSDSFSYIATNAAGDSQPARVNITVSAVAQGAPPGAPSHGHSASSMLPWILLGLGIALAILVAALRTRPGPARRMMVALFGHWARIRLGLRLGPGLGLITERLADIDVGAAIPPAPPGRELLGELTSGAPYESGPTDELRRANAWAAALEEAVLRNPDHSLPSVLITYGFVRFDSGVRLSVIHYCRVRDAFLIRRLEPIELGGHSFPVIVRPWCLCPQQGPASAGAGTCWVEFAEGNGSRCRGILTASHTVRPKGAAPGAEVTLNVARPVPGGRLRLDSPQMDAAVIEVADDRWAGAHRVYASRVLGYKPVRLLGASRSVEADVVEHSGFVGGAIPGQLGVEPLTPTLLILNKRLNRGDSGCIGLDLEFAERETGSASPPYLLYQGIYATRSGANGYGLMLEQARIVWALDFYR